MSQFYLKSLSALLVLLASGCATTSGGNVATVTQPQGVRLDLAQEGDEQLSCGDLEVQFMEVDLARARFDTANQQQRENMRSARQVGQMATRQSSGNELTAMLNMFNSLTETAATQSDADNELNYQQATKRMERIDRLYTRKNCGKSLMDSASTRSERRGRNNDADDDSDQKTTRADNQAQRQNQRQNQRQRQNQQRPRQNQRRNP